MKSSLALAAMVIFFSSSVVAGPDGNRTTAISLEESRQAAKTVDTSASVNEDSETRNRLVRNDRIPRIAACRAS